MIELSMQAYRLRMRFTAWLVLFATPAAVVRQLDRRARGARGDRPRRLATVGPDLVLAILLPFTFTG